MWEFVYHHNKMCYHKYKEGEYKAWKFFLPPLPSIPISKMGSNKVWAKTVEECEFSDWRSPWMGVYETECLPEPYGNSNPGGPKDWSKLVYCGHMIGSAPVAFWKVGRFSSCCDVFKIAKLSRRKRCGCWTEALTFSLNFWIVMCLPHIGHDLHWVLRFRSKGQNMRAC